MTYPNQGKVGYCKLCTSFLCRSRNCYGKRLAGGAGGAEVLGGIRTKSEKGAKIGVRSKARLGGA
jgi:hypothetical protein